MKVKELLEVISWEVIDYASIYEMRWDEDCQDYFPKYMDKRVNNKQDLEPYLECELHYLDYHTQWGEYDDSGIYITMSKEETTNE